MPEDRTVLDHLLDGRDALQREVLRLTAAIEELDAVLGRLGSLSNRGDGSAATVAPAAAEPAAPSQGATTTPEPVNPPAEVEAPVAATVPARPRVTRKPPAKKSSRARGAGSQEPPKSIRVHVLEMLQAENREFGLAEIIDRVHDAGIQAHDDAVRSITIKLMKDGRVERVGRGQYRLARRGSATRASAAVATAPRVTESAPESDPLPAAEPVPVSPVAEAAAEAEVESTRELTPEPAPEATEVPEMTADETTDETQAGAEDGTSAEYPITPPPYAPSLNLGQPWNT